LTVSGSASYIKSVSVIDLAALPQVPGRVIGMTPSTREAGAAFADIVYADQQWVDAEFDALISASIALTLWGSAQVAEATRGAVQSIPKEQHEAAAALGFGWIGRHACVILPQALRRLLPPLVSLLVNIIQNSTIAQVIGAPELLESAERQVERLAAPPPIGIGEVEAIPIYATVMVIFFCISFPLTRLSAYLEKRLQ